MAELLDHEALSENELWERYKREQDNYARGELVKRYLRFSKSIAVRIFRAQAPSGIDFRDLQQAASLGLIKAMEAYDPVRGPFSSFASHRIRGEVLDQLARNSDTHAQRWTAHELRRERIASLRGTVRVERTSRDVFLELAEVAIGLAIGFMLEDSPMFLDERAAARYGMNELAATRTEILSLVEELEERECFVIRYHYVHELPFKEIAELLGLTPGRISQIHGVALRKLKQGLMSTQPNSLLA